MLDTFFAADNVSRPNDGNDDWTRRGRNTATRQESDPKLTLRRDALERTRLSFTTVGLTVCAKSANSADPTAIDLAR